MSAGELILYRSQDGSARIQLRAVDGRGHFNACIRDDV